MPHIELKEVQNALAGLFENVSVNDDGVYTARRYATYPNNNTGDVDVVKRVHEVYPGAYIVSKGQVKAERSSHWYVQFTL